MNIIALLEFSILLGNFFVNFLQKFAGKEFPAIFITKFSDR